MPGYLETLEPADLMGFISSHTVHMPLSRRRSERRGYAKTERGASHLVKSLQLGIIGLSMRHTEYSLQSAWRGSRIGRAILGYPANSGEIMVIDFVRPQVSRNIIVTPERPCPVLVTEGNLPEGSPENWLVREPHNQDLELINGIIEAIYNHPSMAE